MEKADEVLNHYKKISILESIQAQLEWDMETMMPKDSVDLRSEQMQTLSGLIFEKESDPKYVDSVFSFSLPAFPESLREKQLKRLQKELHKRLCLDVAFVSRQTELRVAAVDLWKKAKANNDFSIVKDILEDLVGVQREWAERLKSAPALKAEYTAKSLYDIHLDAFEPGMPSEFLRKKLQELGSKTKEILPLILEKQKESSEKTSFAMTFERQKELSQVLARTLGYDFSRGRLDSAVHPFCGGSPGDTRITTRYNEKDFSDCFYSVIHETGHALYEQGLPTHLRHTPCGRAASFGIHESQSRLLENQIGRSRAFCAYLATLVGIDEKVLFKHFNTVQKSFIRTESDELTYNLHILLRMEIEEDLLHGKIRVKDLPEVWNERFKDLFALTVPSSSQGVLQDTHWYSGLFGYFPTYSIGNILAAQLFSNFKKTYGDWESKVASGNFQDLRTYLNHAVHSQAGLGNSPETIQKAVGGDLHVGPFIDYIREKYVS